MTLASKTIGNALAGVIGFVWLTILALATTPYIVNKLGNDVYGILALVTSMMGFLAFLDLGVTNAAVKYIAESYARNDINEISKIVGSSLSLFLAVGALGAALIVAMTSVLIQDVLKIPAGYMSDTRFAFFVAACGFVLNMGVGVLGAIPRAIQRYDLGAKVNIVVGTCITLSTVLVVHLGYGLRQVVILNFVSSAISLCVYAYIAKRQLRGLSLAIGIHPATFKKLMQFGIYSLVVMISSAILLNFDRLLIGSFIGSSAVAFYVVPASIAAVIRNVDISLTGVVFPLCSHLSATGEFDKMRDLYVKASKYSFMVVLSLAIPIIVLSEKIMTIWVGPEYGLNSSLVLALLTFGAAFNSIATIPFFILDGAGMPHVNAKYAFLSAIVNVVICFLLIPKFGLMGAAFGNLANVVFVAAYLVTVDREVMHIGIGRVVRDVWLRPTALGLFQAAITYFALMPSVTGKVSLILVLACSIGFYYVAALLLKVINVDDRYIIKAYVNMKISEKVS